jgi:hypothetical protein
MWILKEDPMRMMKRVPNKKPPWPILNYTIRVYPSSLGCVKPNMNRVKPEQMPPLMVRKAGWRR